MAAGRTVPTRQEERVTQLMPLSSRHGRSEPDARHATHHHLGYPPLVLSSRPARGRHATPRGQNFERIIGWTILGSIIPGSGLIAAGRRAAGRIALGATVLLALGGGIAYLLVDPVTFAASLMADPNKILIAAVLLVLLAIGWVAMVLSTHAATRRYGNLTGVQRALATALVTALVAVVVVPTAIGAQGALLASDALRSVFQDNGPRLNKDAKAPDTSKPDPWASIPRVNVLLMGSDSGLGRVGVRPDTMIVASIDTTSGNTVLISLPRNLERVPFPPDSKGAGLFPNGFYCYNSAASANTECLLNSLWTWGVDHASYYPGDDNPGLTATVGGIEQLTNLKIDEYVMLNLKGFADFVNAIGGVTLTAKQRIPVGGHGSPGASGGYSPPTSWIEPGKQHLNGYYALWFARSRQYSTDFDRMQRQRCVIGAVITQVNPVALALGFADIMATLKKNVRTSIPAGEVEAWATLAQRVKKAKVTSLAFTEAVINPGRPDITKMHNLVDQALNPPPKSAATVDPSATAPTKKKGKAVTTPAETGQAADLSTVC